MAPNDSDAQTTRPARAKLARYGVPVAVAGVAAATIGLVPALAASGDPDLPKITAQELIEKIAASDVQQMSGTLKVSTDLGLPAMAGLGDLIGGDTDAAASADAKLMELASGTHTLRVAADGPDRQRLTIQDDDDEYTLIHNRGEVWAYDSKANEVVHEKNDDQDDDQDGGRDGHRPGDRAGDADGAADERSPQVTPKELATEALKAVDGTTSVTVDGTARVAGRDAYQLVIKPKQSGSTIGSIKVAVDARNGVPLKFTLTPGGGGKAAVDAGFTKVDFSKPDASTFTFTPPKGAKVTEADDAHDAHEHEPVGGLKDKDRKALEEGLEGLEGLDDFHGLNVIGEGWTTVVELAGPGGVAGGGQGAPRQGGPKQSELPPEAQQFLDGLGSKVTGKFGSGTVFKTRLVNALMTDDGKVYVGAVTEQALVAAANDAAK
ncbi:outer membrane lipoprotein carrier protein LolA [Streptomyces sp. TRM49041]|uniref:LolA family protein n=1 Tax=Streptomyces sp. TRM49041 TaxID=2603216 RepID=UPI0011F00C00|nr:outer membrane lipoprotein carrier protein LolA [Streptomyces sp. TRM49041]